MTRSKSNPIALYYLDPISLGAAIQLIGGAAAWAWVRLRRLRRTLGAPNDDGPIGLDQALDQLLEPSKAPRLVVIMEGQRDWPFLESVAANIDASSFDLWVISREDFSIKERLSTDWRVVSALTEIGWQALLSRLHADMVLTTLTDLGSPQFPKSKTANYSYVFHSLVSVHQAYSTNAFDGFDIFFVPGDRHMQELLDLFKLKGVEPPEIRIVGYPLLDCPIRQPLTDGRPSALIAPSWSSDELYEDVWVLAAERLLLSGWIVTLRPHPETQKRSEWLHKLIRERLKHYENFVFDLSSADGNPADLADILVTDWSGISLEWIATGSGRVIFVDTPLKVRNSKGIQANVSTIEQDIRGDNVVTVDEIGAIAQKAAHRLKENPSTLPEGILLASSLGVAGQMIASTITQRIRR